MVQMIWKPISDDPALFYVISAAWGVCNAIWEMLNYSECTIDDFPKKLFPRNMKNYSAPDRTVHGQLGSRFLQQPLLQVLGNGRGVRIPRPTMQLVQSISIGVLHVGGDSPVRLVGGET